MEKTEWKADIATNIAEIDKQHKTFLKLCDEIVQYADKSLNSAKIVGSISKLEKFAVVHFATEGKLMSDTLYPDKKGHFKLHSHFFNELQIIKSMALAGQTGSDFAKEIKERIADWFVLHIKKNDIKMASYVIKK